MATQKEKTNENVRLAADTLKRMIDRMEPEEILTHYALARTYYLAKLAKKEG